MSDRSFYIAISDPCRSCGATLEPEVPPDKKVTEFPLRQLELRVAAAVPEGHEPVVLVTCPCGMQEATYLRKVGS